MNFLCAFFLIAGVNLIPNGDFSKGKVYPEHWEKPDGLTSFYVSDPERGRVLKLDSRMDAEQVRTYHRILKKNPDARAPKPVLPKSPYAAIGGLDGVMADSVLIPVKKGQSYKLTVDIRGNSKPFVWIKGFRKHPRRPSQMIDSYQTRLHGEDLSPNEWKTFSIGFNPTKKSPQTEWMKVRCYVFWPLGVCYFSNIRVEEITPEEMKELEKKREEVKKERF